MSKEEEATDVFYKTMIEFNKTEKYLAAIYTRHGMILAANARVEGMKAANMQREVLGQSMAYTQDEFEKEADKIHEAAMFLNGFL